MTQPASAAARSRDALGASFARKARRRYVHLLFDVLGRLLVAGSVADPTLHGELEGFPEGYSISFSVLGDSAGVRVAKRGSRFVLEPASSKRADLQIVFKHIAHAFALLSLQESTPRAFANGRMVIDGDIALAMRFMRCLDRVQGVLLPDLVAVHALKSLPKIPLAERLRLSGLIARGLVQSYFERSVQ